jgi:hypothetical protein
VLPAAMLACAGRLPVRGDWAYEVKWDGFRAIVSSENGLEVRRGWSMTELLPELAGLPKGLVLDGELVALGRRRQAARPSPAGALPYRQEVDSSSRWVGRERFPSAFPELSKREAMQTQWDEKAPFPGPSSVGGTRHCANHATIEGEVIAVE